MPPVTPRINRYRAESDEGRNNVKHLLVVLSIPMRDIHCYTESVRLFKDPL